jgi:hypothetical protein
MFVYSKINPNIKQMKRIKLLLALIFITLAVFSQKDVYWTSGGEIIFSWGQLAYTDAYAAANPQAEIANYPVRFTCFLHFQQFVNLDFGNNIGIMSGFALRNIGMISDENTPDSYAAGNTAYTNTKIIRRTYSLGVPLALKLGSFKDHFFLYGGGEMEWAFVYKEKFWNEYDRDGTKTKTVDWFGNNVTQLLPSAFVGIQFPKGANLKFKYYLEDFLNHDIKYNNVADVNTTSKVVSDLSKYKQSQLFYVSLTFMFNTSEFTKAVKNNDEVASIR